MSAIQARVRASIERTFGISSSITEYSMGAIPAWDSLGHMNLIAELEKEFNIRFPTYALSQITSEAEIIRAVQERS